LGESKISERSKLNWGISYNIIDGSMPDRVQNVLEMKLLVINYRVSQSRQSQIFSKIKGG
jgi:hypothetical protein